MCRKGSSEKERVRGKREKIYTLRRIKYVGENQINKDDLVKGPPHIRDFLLTLYLY
jgi:hypothetical protein